MDKKYEVVEDFDLNATLPLKTGEIICISTQEEVQELISAGKIKEVTE